MLCTKKKKKAETIEPMLKGVTFCKLRVLLAKAKSLSRSNIIVKRSILTDIKRKKIPSIVFVAGEKE